jgi:TonB family protein
MTLRKNTDPTLRATHTIDLKFAFADGAPITGFKDVGLPQMRTEDPTAAEALTSAKAKINDTSFLIALAKSDTDTARNLDLMKTRSWFDFPLLLNDDRIAKVVFQKSPEGQAMLDKAFEAWGTPAPAETAPAVKPPVGEPLPTVEDLPQYKFAREGERSPIAGGSAESRYLTTVYGMIKAHVHETPELHVDSANKRGMVDFYVDEGGNLVGHKLTSSSGSPNLDAAVMTAIAAAAPYPMPPRTASRRSAATQFGDQGDAAAMCAQARAMAGTQRMVAVAKRPSMNGPRRSQEGG